MLNPTAIHVKKLWMLPELILIDRDTISAKHSSGRHEASFTADPVSPGDYHFQGGTPNYGKGTVTIYVS